MRRLIFFIMIFAAIGFSLYVVLGQASFLMVTTGNALADGIQNAIGMTGADIFRGFFENIGNSDTWGTTAGHFMTYGIVLFVILCALCVLSLVLILLLNGFALGRSRRLYRNANWFFTGALFLTGTFIWYAVWLMNNTPESSWSIRTLSWWFYIPFALALVMNIIAGSFAASERGRRR